MGSQGPVAVTLQAADLYCASQLERDRQQAHGQWHSYVRAAEGELAVFKRRVQDWQQRCVPCELDGDGALPSDHSLWRCPTPQGAAAREAAKRVQKAYRLEAGAGDRMCLMPYSMCGRWTLSDQPDGARRHNSAGRCWYNGVIIAGWVGGFYSRDYGPWSRAGWRRYVHDYGVDADAALDWSLGGAVMRLLGQLRPLNAEEGVCEFAAAFSHMVGRVEGLLERRRGVGGAGGGEPADFATFRPRGVDGGVPVPPAPPSPAS